MWTLPGAPARQARVNASEALSPVQAAIVAPVVSQPSAPPAVASQPPDQSSDHQPLEPHRRDIADVARQPPLADP